MEVYVSVLSVLREFITYKIIGVRTHFVVRNRTDFKDKHDRVWD